jgi:hypothetical protein
MWLMTGHRWYSGGLGAFTSFRAAGSFRIPQRRPPSTPNPVVGVGRSAVSKALVKLLAPAVRAGAVGSRRSCGLCQAVLVGVEPVGPRHWDERATGGRASRSHQLQATPRGHWLTGGLTFRPPPTKTTFVPSGLVKQPSSLAFSSRKVLGLA